MTNVNLPIAGRNYTVSAADGEEAHIEMLGRMIADRAQKMAGSAGQSEPRTLLFAALILADELHEAHKMQAPPPAPAAVPLPAGPSPEVVARVEALAARVEKLALHLEQQGEAS